MPARTGCDKHPEFDMLCIDCWDTDSRRMRTFIEKEFRNQKQSARFKRDALKVLRGSE
jgi:3-methyladenine DNA glycosylase AlkC